MSSPNIEPLFKHITLIGAGLIGSSIARVIKLRKLAENVTEVARSQATLDTMIDLGLTDSITLDVVEAVKNADLII